MVFVIQLPNSNNKTVHLNVIQISEKFSKLLISTNPTEKKANSIDSHIPIDWSVKYKHVLTKTMIISKHLQGKVVKITFHCCFRLKRKTKVVIEDCDIKEIIE